MCRSQPIVFRYQKLHKKLLSRERHSVWRSTSLGAIVVTLFYNSFRNRIVSAMKMFVCCGIVDLRGRHDGECIIILTSSDICMRVADTIFSVKPSMLSWWRAQRLKLPKNVSALEPLSSVSRPLFVSCCG